MLPSLAVVVANHRLLADLAIRTIAVLLAAAFAALALVGPALAILVARRAERQGRALTVIGARCRGVATLPRGAIAVRTADAFATLAAARFALIVAVAPSAQRQIPVFSTFAEVLRCNRRAADLTGRAVAIGAADALPTLTPIRPAFVVTVALGTQGQIDAGAIVLRGGRFETALAARAVAVLIALAGAALAMPGLALVVGAAFGAQRQIAAANQRSVIYVGDIVLAKILGARAHHIDRVVIEDKLCRVVVVGERWKSVRMASFVDDDPDKATQGFVVIHPVIVADVYLVAGPAMRHAPYPLSRETGPGSAFLAFILADNGQPGPFPDELVSIGGAEVGEFPGDTLQPRRDVVSGQADIALGNLVAFTN